MESVGFSDSDDVSDLRDGIIGVKSVGFSDLNDVSDLRDGIRGEVSVGVDKSDFEKSRADLINHQALQSNRVCFIHPISKKVIDIGLNIDGIYKEFFE